MAAELGQDQGGVWAAIDCEAPGCYGHVTVRPEGSDWSAVALLRAAGDMADAEGWSLVGSTWCPRHGWRAPRTDGTVGEHFVWVTVVNGARWGL